MDEREMLEIAMTFLQDRILFHKETIDKLHTNKEDIDISRGQILECQYLLNVLFNELVEGDTL